jgi:hypothetical protein
MNTSLVCKVLNVSITGAPNVHSGEAVECSVHNWFPEVSDITCTSTHFCIVFKALLCSDTNLIADFMCLCEPLP